MSAAAAAAAGPAGGTKREVLKYGAHYNAYSKSGDTHFNTYVDALRELVDNSVQYALDGNTQAGENPEIRIIISLKGQAKDHTVAVGDNGRGMNEEHLRDFLMYFKTQEDRGIVSAASGTSVSRTMDDNEIGKYGIGAKEAVFFLGDGVSLVTKHNDEPYVRRISMSKVRYKQRAEAEEEALQDTMLTDKWEHGAPLPAPEDLQLCEAVGGEDGLLQRYTYDTHYNLMILPQFEHSSRLLGTNPDETKKHVNQLAQELANTYAFSMFPEKYDQLWNHRMSTQASQAHRSTKGCKIDLIFRSDDG